MWVSQIQLENYRNYSQQSVALRPGITMIHGENGEGKTNLVEALVFLANLQSHRVAGYQPLIARESNTSRLSAVVNHEGRSLNLAAELNRSSSNRYFVNSNQQKRANDLLGHLKAVIFAPEDLDLVRRDPQDRRAFLDSAIVLLKPRMAGVFSDYDRVIKQRNALLKSARGIKNPDMTTLDIWDDQLVQFGAEIIYARLNLVSDIEPLLRNFYRELSLSDEEINLEIRSSIVAGSDEEDLKTLRGLSHLEIKDLFLETLHGKRANELERGVCLVGPHRDELLISKNDLVAKSHSSQGEAWSLALGLKLALAELIRADSFTGDPVLILDDVYSVLDSGRRARLTSFVSKNEQVLITTADKSVTPDLEWAAQLEIQGGVVLG